MRCWQDCPTCQWRRTRASSMQPSDSCLAYGTATTSPRRRSSSTGYLPKLAFSTNCVCFSTPCSHLESTRVHHWLLPVAAVTSRQTVLRSATTNTLFTPRTRLRFGERAFRVATPKAWNQLPNNVRSLRDTNSQKETKNFFIYKILLCVICI